MKIRQSRQRLALIAGAALIAIAVAACGGGSTSSGPAAGTPPKHGGTLRLAQIGEVETLNPIKGDDFNSINPQSQIFETLVKTNAQGKLEPWLAESYESSPDAKVWTFDLRHGVKFSDGRPL